MSGNDERVERLHIRGRVSSKMSYCGRRVNDTNSMLRSDVNHLSVATEVYFCENCWKHFCYLRENIK